jgi:hypothetical protein
MLIYMLLYQHVFVIPSCKFLSQVILLTEAHLNLLRHGRDINLSKKQFYLQFRDFEMDLRILKGHFT